MSKWAFGPAMCFLAGGIALTSTVQAQPTTGWYSRLALNYTSIDFERLDAASITVRADDDDVGFDLAIGYRFNANFGLELGYADLGSQRVVFACEEVLCLVTPDPIELEPSAISLIGIASLPLTDRFSLQALLGAAAVDTELGDDTELEAGLGAAFQISRELSLDLRYSLLAFDEVDDFDIFELGLGYSF